MSERTCPSCGETVAAGRGVCPACGVLLGPRTPPADMVSPAPPVAVAAASRPTAPTAPPTRASAARSRSGSSRGGCLLVLVAIVAVAAVAGGVVVRQRRDQQDAKDRAAREAHTGAERSPVLAGPVRFTLYDKADRVFHLAPSALGPDFDAAKLQLGGWRVQEDGWQEQVAVFAIPSDYEVAQQFVDHHSNDIAFDMTQLTSLDMPVPPVIDGEQPARIFEADVNTPMGVAVPTEADAKYHTQVAIVRADDNRHFVAFQLTWREGHEPPPGEMAQLRRSLQG